MFGFSFFLSLGVRMAILCPSRACDSCYVLSLSFLVNKCPNSRIIVCVFQIWKIRHYRSSIAVDLFQYDQLERLTMVMKTILIKELEWVPNEAPQMC